MQDEDDSANMFWQTQGLQQQFEAIFIDEVSYGLHASSKETVPSKRNIMEGWSDQRKEEWRKA
jgi:hypothetical protein